MPAKGVKIAKRESIIGKEMYKFYKESVETPIDYPTFIKIIVETNKEIKDWVLDNESGFMLPYQLGFLAINQVKQRKPLKPIDYYNTKLYKKRIPNLNLHTYGKVYWVCWFNEGLHTKRIKIYKFAAERKFKRQLAQRIFKGNVLYNRYERNHFKNIFLSHFNDE